MAQFFDDNREVELALTCSYSSVSPVSVYSLSNSESFQELLSDIDQIKSWIETADSLKKENGLDVNLQNLDKKLLPVVFVIDNKISLADIFLYVALHPVMTKLNEKQRGKYHNVLRYFDFLQNQKWNNSSILNHVLSKRSVVLQGLTVSLDSYLVSSSESPATSTPQTTQNQPPQEKKAENSSEKPQQQQQQQQQTKEKKAKGQPAAQAKQEPETLSPSALDIRVGKVIEVQKHPDADSLYVEKIDLGESEPRTIVSGLVKFISVEDFQNQLVLVLCNLKPASMRGVKSSGMVLCASNAAHDAVELVQPPSDTPIGERIHIEGEGTPTQQQEPVMNPKKKIWETLQPGLKTNEDLIATWNGKAFLSSKGVCKAKSLAGANIK